MLLNLCTSKNRWELITQKEDMWGLKPTFIKSDKDGFVHFSIVIETNMQAMELFHFGVFVGMEEGIAYYSPKTDAQ